MRRAAYVIVTMAVLTVLNVLVFQKEQVYFNGKNMLVPLEPENRSFPAGSRMRTFRYALYGSLKAQFDELPLSGALVVNLDDRNIASFRRLHRPGEALSGGEYLLRYRRDVNDLYIGPINIFLSAEEASSARRASYGAFRVSDVGDVLLTGLLDQGLQPIGSDMPGMFAR